ncbi:MAG: nucleotidyltransferase domain-containing protein [Eubacteriaceae bacterium]|uniref:Nucleotidyltransferase domain-containing protein n=1 Tax=Candidatus Pseudoramibacter fermentans TaxID=2594427 RepID=A0A6L5GUU9_9FIRM|nr:nucleotidyltransferase domain-containing protein [Candidatus Pseudoramibacter fermentans]RRF92707.1 MAG: nucleotidyltransferase domain-containing protein [Eubacteriaceae bacterium]
MQYNIPDRVRRELTKIAQDHRIEKIILFGSRARGTQRERSDIDIAVSGGDVDGFYWDLKEKNHSLLMFDVVDLNQPITDALRKEITKDGVILYEKV